MNANKNGVITVVANAAQPQSSSSGSESGSDVPQSSSDDNDETVESSDSGSSGTVEESGSNTTSFAAVSSAPRFEVVVENRTLSIRQASGMRVSLFDMQGRLLLTKDVGLENETMLLPRTGSFVLRIGNRSVRIEAE